MEYFEYKVEYGTDIRDLEPALNGSAKEGWELDKIRTHPESPDVKWVVVFKYKTQK